MIKLLRYLKTSEWILLLLSIAFIVGQVALDLTLPEYLGKITLLVQTEGSQMRDILHNGGLMILITFTSMLLSMIIAGLAAKIATNHAARLRGLMFDKVLSYTMPELNDFSISSLITRSTNDVLQVQSLVVTGLPILVRSPLLALWAVIKIMDKNWQWSAVTAGAVLALIMVAAVYFVLAIPKFAKMQEQTDELNRMTRENLIGIRVVRAYNAERFQAAKFHQANLALTNTNLFTNRLMATLMPCIDLIMNGLTLAVYWIGAGIVAGAAAVHRVGAFADMMVFAAYSIQILMAFMMLVIVFLLIPRATVAAKRISEVLETQPTIADGPGPAFSPLTKSRGEIEFRNVSFKYPDAEEYVLENISFKVRQGETIAFIGSTGSGKSTIINLIPRFYDTTRGEVLVNGVNVRDYTGQGLREKIGYVAQKAVLFKGSVTSNVLFGQSGPPNYPPSQVIEAVRFAQGAEFVEQMPDTYQAYVAPGGTNLSGGQKQRLSIARALAKKAEILIFDDSFSALDYKTDRLLRKALKENTWGTTVLIVAQRIGTIMEADKIFVLEEGAMVGFGTHRELMHSCRVYQEIAHSQLSKEELAL
ncbi:MAG: putative ABC transporter ATP-binding protein [Firmicutes bacterium]|nr:putative ABC transporter ATP-binding protein [Bacillota bacterium]